MKLPSGTDINTINGYIGIREDDLDTCTGYDDAVFLKKPYGSELSPAQKIELADRMIELWTAYREKAKEKGH